MKYFLLRAFFILLPLSFAPILLQAQRKHKPPVASNNTSLNTKERPSSKPGKKVYVIYKTDFKETMSGNKCVEDLSRKMRFRYEHLMKKGPGSKTQEGIFLHNLGTKTILMFKNGPFWQIRFRKKMKDCQQKTGDFVG